ncbi:MAG: hypothetical protein MI757_07570 [Pirellulales bacterium]|nr:hypothetical protein [Pirellulales bacterium]
MPQVYGGALALIAFAAIVARGLAHGAHAESTLLAASISLPVFFVVGCVVGWIADRTVDESIRARIEQQLNADQQEVAARRQTSEAATS